MVKLGGASETGEKETLVASDRSVPPDGQEHVVKLAVKEPGLYKLTVSDGNDRTLVNVARDAAADDCAHRRTTPMNGSYGEWMGISMFRREPRSSACSAASTARCATAEDRPQFWLNGRERNFYSVAVPDGQDGKVWRIRYARGAVRLLTVPPYFARTPQELLLPREVVEKDAKK